MKLKDTEAKTAFNYTWLLGKIYPFIKPFLGRVILSLLVAIPVGVLEGVVAYALQPYLDYVIDKKNMFFAYILPFLIIGFALVQGILRYLNSYLTDWTSQKITNSVKTALFAKLVYMDTKFFDENSSGIVLSRYMADPDTASKGIIENIKSLMTNSFGALSLIFVMLKHSWKLALIGVLVLGVAFLPVALIRKRIKKVSNAGMVIGGNITTNLNETYIGNKVMTAYGLQERQKSILNKQIENAFSLQMSLTKRVGWMSPLMYLIASIGIAIVMSYGTYLILDGQMTSGAFASFVTALLLLYKPVKTMGNTLTGLQGIFVAMGRVFELFDHTPELQEKSNAVKMQGLNNDISFNNVSFEYVEGIPVLRNVNLKVNKGETLAVVGNSGGGKTTLVNLIPRFYDVGKGSITFDGTDIRDFTMKSLRDNIAVVFQDNFLYSGTIRENILMGKSDATEEELQSVVTLAHLDEFLGTLPEGIDTVIGERGTTLSGGQRQRVAIARAMIKNTPVVILDEATSALDNKSEAIVQRALDNLIQNKTVFVIAHRLSTIKNADRIAVINEGELVELGTHEELVNIANGQYKHLYEMQFRKQDAAMA